VPPKFSLIRLAKGDRVRRRTLKGITLGIAVGIAVGVGAYTFAYARGWSYLTDNAAACANCHVMSEQYDGWIKSSHRAVAVCNDCHTPANFVGKYATKASNGFWHSFYFTTGGYEDNIMIKPHSREITEQACRKCHEEIVGAIEGTHAAAGGAQPSCVRCHNSVGHLR
jgi:cytochrome c nitrite reductase small subunit